MEVCPSLQSVMQAATNVVLGHLVWVSIVAFQPGPVDNGAKDLLKRALTNQREVDYLHIESRRYGNGDAFALVKVQTVARRGVKVTILQPSYQSGVVTIDDTKSMSTFQPDANQVIVQTSPVTVQPDIKTRWELVQKNYEVRFGAKILVADIPVRELVLEPSNDEVPIRHLFVDPKRAVVLKYQVEDENGDKKTVFDTRYAEFGRAIAEEDFGLPEESKEANVVYVPAPRKVKYPKDSRPELGFSARLPSSLPYGFKVSNANIYGKGDRRHLGVKVTDGMATLTIYEWKRGAVIAPPEARLAVFDRYNIGYGIGVVPGDFMPTEVLRDILDAFKDEGG